MQRKYVNWLMIACRHIQSWANIVAWEEMHLLYTARGLSYFHILQITRCSLAVVKRDREKRRRLSQRDTDAHLSLRSQRSMATFLE